MKAFVAVALAAAAQAAPEADPQVLLAAQPLVYGNAHTQIHSEVKHANGAVVPDDTLSVKAAKAQHLTAKANAYLNKPLVYTAPVVKTVATAPVVQQTLPLVHQTVASPIVSYTGAYPYHFIKREADSEAQPEAEADPALLINGAYSGVYGPRLYGHQLVNPAVTYTTQAMSYVPTVADKPFFDTVVKTPVVSYNYGVHTPLTTGYTGYTRLIKREADSEAEADPLTVVGHRLYGNVYGAGVYGAGVYGAGVYGAHHLVKPVTYTVPAVPAIKTVTAPVKAVVPTVAASSIYSPYVYNTHLIKREAEAEAEAEADPAFFYRNYGYTVPAYTTGYSGYTRYAYPTYGYTGVRSLYQY